MDYNRRDFIKKMGWMYGSILLIPSCTGGASKTRDGDGKSSYRVFTKAEADCLIALCEQIIPADQDAGATDAGVIYFIDRQTYLRFPDDLPTYRKGIEMLQTLCNKQYGLPFEKLNVSTQIEIMKSMQAGGLDVEQWEKSSQQSFFNLVRSRTMQGFYGSPRHGGNKNYVSYRMLKLDYPLIVGQNRYNNG